VKAEDTKIQRCLEDRELNQAGSKPNPVDQTDKTAEGISTKRGR